MDNKNSHHDINVIKKENRYGKRTLLNVQRKEFPVPELPESPSKEIE